MLIRILGSGSLVPNPDRGTAGTLLSSEGSNILVDTGSGTLYRLLKAGLTYNDIDLLCYTHCHLDHFSDFPVFLFTSKYGTPPRATDLTVLGGRGFTKVFEKIKGIYGYTVDSDLFDIDIIEMPELDKAGFNIKSCKIDHSPESVAYRFTSRDDSSVVISGDTDYSTELAGLAASCDVLICECSYPDDMKVEGHLTPSYAGRMARESGAKKLVLTHLYPPTYTVDLVAQAGKEYDGPVVVAKDGMRIDV